MMNNVCVRRQGESEWGRARQGEAWRGGVEPCLTPLTATTPNFSEGDTLPYHTDQPHRTNTTATPHPHHCYSTTPHFYQTTTATTRHKHTQIIVQPHHITANFTSPHQTSSSHPISLNLTTPHHTTRDTKLQGPATLFNVNALKLPACLIRGTGR